MSWKILENKSNSANKKAVIFVSSLMFTIYFNLHFMTITRGG